MKKINFISWIQKLAQMYMQVINCYLFFVGGAVLLTGTQKIHADTKYIIETVTSKNGYITIILLISTASYIVLPICKILLNEDMDVFTSIFQTIFQTNGTIILLYSYNYWSEIYVFSTIFLLICKIIDSERDIRWKFPRALSYDESMLILREEDSATQYDLKIKSVHEAGHAVMAYLCGVTSFHAHVSKERGYVEYQNHKSMNADDLYKCIIVYYAGSVAEKMIFGFMSDGSMGDENADFQKANECIKMYLMLTNDELSKTGSETELHNEMIRISKQCFSEAEETLRGHKETVRRTAMELMQRKNMYAEDIKKIFLMNKEG